MTKDSGQSFEILIPLVLPDKVVEQSSCAIGADSPSSSEIQRLQHFRNSQ